MLRLLCKRLWTLLISGSLVILQYVFGLLAPTQELSVASLSLTHKQFWNTVEVLASRWYVSVHVTSPHRSKSVSSLTHNKH